MHSGFCIVVRPPPAFCGNLLSYGQGHTDAALHNILLHIRFVTWRNGWQLPANESAPVLHPLCFPSYILAVAATPFHPFVASKEPLDYVKFASGFQEAR
jgi:hypothetical protein